MKICKVDDRGRLQLKRAVKNLPHFYRVDEEDAGELYLTPIKTVSLKDLGFEEEERKNNESD